jgi:hypothetical protein
METEPGADRDDFVGEIEPLTLARRQAAPIVCALARVMGVRNDERAWRIGGDREEVVDVRLSRLGTAWKVVPAASVGRRGRKDIERWLGPMPDARPRSGR